MNVPKIFIMMTRFAYLLAILPFGCTTTSLIITKILVIYKFKLYDVSAIMNPSISVI
jgi:hypothetical protein